MFGEYVDAALSRARISRAELARRIGVTPDLIGKYVRGDVKMTLERLSEIATALGLHIGDLLPNSGGSARAERFAPIAHAMIGLPDSDIDELILNLAAQARILTAWRKHEDIEFRQPTRVTVMSVTESSTNERRGPVPTGNE
jgi:transcriptional regulator with XRE-family HTH domain